MHPVLEHRSFSVGLRIRFLEQNLGLEITYQHGAAVREFNDKTSRKISLNDRTRNRMREHLPHNRMFGADDGASMLNSENLLLDEIQFVVVGRSSEESGDLFPDIAFVHPGGMGMTRCNVASQFFHIIRFKGSGGKSVPVCVYTSFADCKETEYLEHFIASHGIVPSVSRVSDDSGNQLLLNITNVALARAGEDIDNATLRRKGYTHSKGRSRHCFLPLRQKVYHKVDTNTSVLVSKLIYAT